jgi:hypothetical protein
MRRAEDRQIEYAGQLDVIDIAPFAAEEFKILSPAQRPTDKRG